MYGQLEQEEAWEAVMSLWCFYEEKMLELEFRLVSIYKAEKSTSCERRNDEKIEMEVSMLYMLIIEEG